MTHVRATTPRDLLAYIAHRMGFHPTESVVMTVIQGKTAGLIARIDLAHVQDMAPALVLHATGNAADGVVLVTYSDNPDAAHHGAAVLIDALAAAQIPTSTTLWVDGNKYRQITPHQPQACPAHGEPLNLDTTTVAATLVHHGSPGIQATREDLQITPGDPTERTAAHRAQQATAHPRTAATRTAALADWTNALPGDLTPEQAGRLAAALADVLTRDVILATIITGTDDLAHAVAADPEGKSDELGAVIAALMDPTHGAEPDRDALVPVRAALARIAALTDSPAALTMLGLLAWWEGDGPRANVLTTQALEAAPTYSLARLVDQVLAGGIPPGWLRQR